MWFRYHRRCATQAIQVENPENRGGGGPGKYFLGSEDK
jgi:hypothetical protein